MPIKKAAFKALKQAKKGKARNLAAISKIKTLIKKANKEIILKNKEKSAGLVAQAVKALDKAKQHKILKKNAVARKKSRLVNKLNAIK